MYPDQTERFYSMNKWYRILKLCFPVVGIFILLPAAVYYWEMSSINWSKTVFVDEVALRHTLKITESRSEHPCVRLLRKVHFDGLNDKTVILDEGGCPLKQFTGRRAFQCLNGTDTTHIMFIGDSRVRQLFEYFRKMLTEDTNSPLEKYQNNRITLIENIITVEFKWQPHADLGRMFTNILKSTKKPVVLLVGSGVWAVRESNGTTEGVKLYKRDLTDSLLPLTELAAKHTDVLWIPQDPTAEEMKEKERWMFSNKLLNIYNSVAYNLMTRNDIRVWKSSRLVANHFPGHHRDCVHFHSIVDKYKTQILFNWLCNRKKEKTRCCA